METWALYFYLANISFIIMKTKILLKGGIYNERIIKKTI